MQRKRTIGHLHLITDTTVQNRYTPAELAELAIAGGCDTVQYRNKSNDIRLMIREASDVAEVCRRNGVTFLVNDRVDLCQAVDADGVHLGLEDMPVDRARRILGPEKVIGATIRNVDHLQQATRSSADYVGLGPIFRTSSKQLPLSPVGPDGVRRIAAVSRLPVIAVAGITAENAAPVVVAGAYGVAVIGALAAAVDVTAAAVRLRNAVDRALPATGRLSP